MRLGAMGSVLGALAVAAGAFGAHALRGRLDPSAMATFETAVRYHLIHAVAVLLAAERARAAPKPAGAAGALFVLGILLFSGSLYALAMGSPRWLGAVTPFGGLAFMLGWLLLAASYRNA